MRIIKWGPEVESIDIVSIAKNKTDGTYGIDYGNKVQIALITITNEDFLNIQSDNTEKYIKTINEALGTDHKKMEFSAYLDDRTDITGLQELYCIVSVQKNEQRNELPYGVFEVNLNNYGLIVFKEIKTDTACVTLLKNHDLTDFVKELQEKKSSNRKNKKGVLLYGPPGNGKTSDIFELRKFCTAENKTRMFFVDPQVSLKKLNQVRQFFQDDITIFVFEEITARINMLGLAEMLTFLDGEDSWYNSLVIATTNNPEEMPANLVDRPGRFETFIEYKKPTNEQIEALNKLFGNTCGTVDILKGKDLSFDYVSFILDRALQDKATIKETYEYQMSRRKILSETFKGKIGL